MTAGHPSLGAEIFQVDPDWFGRALGHGQFERLGKMTGKRLDHHVTRVDRRKIGMPAAYFDTGKLLQVQRWIDCRINVVETDQIVHPQAHPQTMLGSQLASQSPRDADIAEIVDNGAEDVPTDDRPEPFSHCPAPVWLRIDQGNRGGRSATVSVSNGVGEHRAAEWRVGREEEAISAQAQRPGKGLAE